MAEILELDERWRQRVGTRPVNRIVVLDNGQRIQIDFGWAPLIVWVDDALRTLEPTIRLDDVKEKYGSLRVGFLVPGGVSIPRWEELDALCDEAEARSLTVCQWCGAPGRLREDQSWLATLCDACQAASLQRDRHVDQQVQASLRRTEDRPVESPGC